MQSMRLIPDNYLERLCQTIETSWSICANQFLRGRHTIENEASLQLQFAVILKQIGNLYCLRKEDRFSVELEAKHQFKGKDNFIDIVCVFSESIEEVKIPIELKYPTRLQGAQNLQAMEIYKDICVLDNLLMTDDTYEYAYFFIITDDHLYFNPPKKDTLRYEYNTSHGYVIQPGYGYKSTATKTGCEFYKKNGSLTFTREHIFNWLRNDSFFFLEMKLGGMLHETT